MQIILKYFHGLTSEQISHFKKIGSLYQDWNVKTKILPRNEIDSIYERHILYSLAIAKIIRFTPGSKILDVGTGGGFPGIPLAIFFPSSQFVLIDPIAKRINMVELIARELKLSNVIAIRSKVEVFTEKFDFVASRAVTSFPTFVGLVKKNISADSKNVLPNGIMYLKGGSHSEELSDFMDTAKIFEIPDFFPEPFFESKKVIYLPVV